ncbi:hypothetical protein CC85DRAFT_330269 [Cutaneotrichosporon oleaginosum]|uniref:Uncharacterized protein n=1 Tax=Cutaneotrichosporon oleaginosum TaxID=879819 RepID=A0A0J0XG78_9TREE|nr:uncharacterized protein CC85DRAFT_330269 [Cutaneotrichosporon oleaginosum]KLT40056.1 hypothetical protein CC85DRAFT_330269 [Cutaneotrichosporon oleaginosum]
MTTSALIGGVVGGVAGLGLIVGFAWAGYLVAERRRRGQLCALKVDVETPAVRTLVPVPMPGATYEPPVPILVAAHTGWGVRPPTRPKARRMMRSPARRASENALPALLELGESEFEECLAFHYLEFTT